MPANRIEHRRRTPRSAGAATRSRGHLARARRVGCPRAGRAPAAGACRARPSSAWGGSPWEGAPRAERSSPWARPWRPLPRPEPRQPRVRPRSRSRRRPAAAGAAAGRAPRPRRGARRGTLRIAFDRARPSAIATVRARGELGVELCLVDVEVLRRVFPGHERLLQGSRDAAVLADPPEMDREEDAPARTAARARAARTSAATCSGLTIGPTEQEEVGLLRDER